MSNIAVSCTCFLKMHALVRGFLRCCLFVGIYTRTTSSENNYKNWPKLLRTLSYLYPWLIMLLVLLSASYAVLQRNFDEGYLLSNLVATLVFVGQIFAHCIVLLEAQFKREQHEMFHQKLAEIEELLWLRLRQRALRTHCVRCLKRKYCSLGLLSILGASVFANFASNYYWHGVFSIFTMRLRIFQLMLYVDYLQLYLAALNVKLQQLVARKCYAANYQLLDINYKRLESIAYLQAIKQIYALLYEAFGLLNDFSGWSLFATIACYFLDITLHVYWTLLALDGLLPRSTYISSTAALTPLAAIVVALSLSCNKCKKAGNLFKKLVNRLINTAASCKPVYKALLFEFVLQVRHQPLIVTAKQIFTFDTGFLMAICVAIATYLIVLIQFLKSENSLNSKL